MPFAASETITARRHVSGSTSIQRIDSTMTTPISIVQNRPVCHARSCATGHVVN